METYALFTGNEGVANCGQRSKSRCCSCEVQEVKMFLKFLKCVK